MSVCLPCQRRPGGLDPVGLDSDRSSWRSLRLSLRRSEDVNGDFGGRLFLASTSMHSTRPPGAVAHPFLCFSPLRFPPEIELIYNLFRTFVPSGTGKQNRFLKHVSSRLARYFTFYPVVVAD